MGVVVWMGAVRYVCVCMCLCVCTGVCVCVCVYSTRVRVCVRASGKEAKLKSVREQDVGAEWL